MLVAMLLLAGALVFGADAVQAASYRLYFNGSDLSAGTITCKANGTAITNGSLVEEGAAIEITITPNTGYAITKTGVGNLGGPYVASHFPATFETKTINAVMKANVTEYYVTFEKGYEVKIGKVTGGTLEVGGHTSDFWALEGQKLPFSLTLDAGYKNGVVTVKENTYHALPKVLPGSEFEMPAVGVTFSAKCEQIQYTITYDPVATVTGEMPIHTVTYGSDYTLRECEYIPVGNMVFVGWNLDGKIRQPDYTFYPDKDITVQAIWALVWDVIYDAGEGKGTMMPEMVREDETYTLPECTFTAPEGKEFDAWEVDGAKKKAGETAKITTHTVVKALWKEIGSGEIPGSGETPAPGETPGSGETPAPEDLPTPADAISPQTPAELTVLEEAITTGTNEEGPVGSTFSLLQAKGTAKSKTSIKLTWKKIPDATGYIIYGNKCGKSNKYKKITTLKKSKKSYTSKKVNGKKLKKGTYYKYIVVAVKGDQVLATSKTIHVATKGGKKGKGNYKSIKLNKSKVTVYVGKTKKVKATLKQGSPKATSHRKVKFESDDIRVATVNKSGKIRGVKAGTCYVYAYAQNGLMAKVKVTVK